MPGKDTIFLNFCIYSNFLQSKVFLQFLLSTHFHNLLNFRATPEALSYAKSMGNGTCTVSSVGVTVAQDLPNQASMHGYQLCKVGLHRRWLCFNAILRADNISIFVLLRDVVSML